MRRRTALATLSAGVGAFALLAGLAAEAAETVQVDGSSTVYPVTEAVAEEFQKAKGSAVRVTVGISGTGGGFKKFCRGEIDIADASRPILATEMEICREAGISYIELPVAFDALTVAVSPRNDFLDSITVAELKKIWAPEAQGVVMKWSDVNPSWPNEEITLYGAGADSGTFDYFTEAVVGKAKSQRGDYTASEDDNVLVQGISGDVHALGYLPYAYVAEAEGQLKVLTIDGGNGTPVGPSEENVKNGTYQPLSRPLFIYVSTKALERPIIKEFVEFYLTEGAALAQEVAYTPLPPKAYEMARARVAEGKTGTVFGGHPEVGLQIDELLTRELKS